MLLTAVLYRQKDKSDGKIFIAGTFLGGAYEYLCSVFTELVFGTVFWDYSGFAFNLERQNQPALLLLLGNRRCGMVKINLSQALSPD